MKYYFVEHYYDKGAPFGTSSRVKLYSGNDLIAIHEHIHYDQIKGYCKHRGRYWFNGCMPATKEVKYLKNYEVKR